MKPLTHSNVHSFCRTCLGALDAQSEKFNIFTMMMTEWVAWLEGGLEVDKPGGPPFVCQQCYDMLRRCHEFRTMARTSMRILADLLSQENEKSQKNKNLETHEEEEDQSDANKDWLEFDRNKESIISKNSKYNAMTQLMETEVFLSESNEYKKENGSESEMEMELLPQQKSDFNDSSDVEPLSQLSKHTTLESTNDSQFEDSEEDENDEYYVEGEDALLSGDFDNSNQLLIPQKTQNTERSSVAEPNAKAARTTSKRRQRANNNSPAPTKKFEVKFQCTRCPRRCISEENLEAHMRTHQGLKPFQCKSVGCARSFNRACHMRSHMAEVHSESQEKIVCTYEGCGKVFRRDASYRVHYRFKHSESKPNWKILVCEDCGRTFKNITTLREHRYKHVPEAEYPFQCEHCGKRYTSQRTYKEHLMRHAGIKNFECPFCGMKKTTRNELRTHINYHTKERQWPCPQCPSVFNSSANLGMHDRVVHKGIRRYSCRYCEQSFGKADTLKHHEMRHTGEKPHVCNICKKRFIQVVALRAHMKTHNKTAKKQQLISDTYQSEHDNGPQTEGAMAEELN